jgi:hypothetical protein
MEFIHKIIKTTVILSVITIIELGMGLAMYAWPMAEGLKLFLKGVIVILSLAKAFYIVGIFMHLGDELKNMIMTIVVPLLLFIKGASFEVLSLIILPLFRLLNHAYAL